MIQYGVPDPLKLSAGSASAPSFSFQAESNTGWYRAGASDMSLSIAGTRRHAWNATTYAILNDSADFRMGASSDVLINRGVTNGMPAIALTLNGTLTGSPTDCPLYQFTPTIAGAFTITRLNYLALKQYTGAATVTDAAALHFDAAVGTHKCLASNAAVAVTIGSGPTGATAGNPQGWMKVNINGTLRYMPFW